MFVVVIIATRTTTKASTDCNESPTTPLGHGTLTGHCLGRTDQGRGSRTTFQVTISARLVSPPISSSQLPSIGTYFLSLNLTLTLPLTVWLC